jgi:CubicO group peptidase (beta-lactamase class C family)
MINSSIQSPDIQRARRILQNAVATRLDEIGDTKVASAIQAVVWKNGELLLDEALGQTFFGRGESGIESGPVHAETPMDIASLTKPLVAATLLMQAVDEGLASFADPVSKYVSGWYFSDDKDRESATLLHLLNHSSGLPAWDKFYLRYPLAPSPDVADATRAEIITTIVRTPLEAPPGTRNCYSDLGYILLGNILERVFDRSLRDLAHERIFTPLDMRQTAYVSPAHGDRPLDAAAATEDCALRKRLVVGTVHDENTEIIGGVSGHAGVFSTARDLLKFCRHILAIDRGTLDRPGIVSRETLRFCLSEKARAANRQPHPGHHLGGWDTPSGKLSSAGRGFQAGNTVGHLGFTGTSIWIERDLDLIAILLTNRVYPTRENALIKDLRVAFHEAVLPPSSR